MSHVFISYSRQDRDYARKLADSLRARGLVAWIDEADIPGGAEWQKTIEENIIRCAAFVVIMTPAAEKSPWVKNELLLAQNKHQPIVPLLLAGEVWFGLLDKQRFDVRDGHLPPEAFYKRLAEVLQPQPPGPPPAPPQPAGGRRWRVILGAAAIILAVVVGGLILASRGPAPGPPACRFETFQVTFADGTLLAETERVTAAPGSALLIEAQVSGCALSPADYTWRAAAGDFLNVSGGGIAYVVPRAGTDVITLTLPENAGDRVARLAVQVAGH